MLVPVNARIGSGWGPRRIDGRDDLHTGLDFAAKRGATVVAALPGVVRLVAEPGEWQRYGRIVVLRHDTSDPRTGKPAPPLFTLYAHLETATVQQGQSVAAGQPIATVGDTGGTRAEPDKRIRAPHLHFELLTRWPPTAIDQDRIDPTPYFDGAAPAPSPAPPPARARSGSGWLVLAFAWWWAKKSAGSGVRARRSVPVQRYSEGTS